MRTSQYHRLKALGLCPNCGRERNNKAFPRCTVCRLKAIQNKGKYKSTTLKREYGITLEVYNQMLASQNGNCNICKRPPTSRALAVDHCHKTGRVRGLLCVRCNGALGWYEKYFQGFQDYLEAGS